MKNKVTKALMAALAAVGISLVGIVPSQASSEMTPTVAIIDTGFDTSRLSSANIVHEVCVVSIRIGCENGTGLHEGEGASGHSYKVRHQFAKDWDHGTQMASIVSEVNPDANIILIRNAKAIRGTVIKGNVRDFEVALEWVADNAEEYNITAVSFSRGSHSHVKPAGSSVRTERLIAAYERVIKIFEARNFPESRIAPYRAKLEQLKPSNASSAAQCPSNRSLEADISKLVNLGVATVIAAGNDGDKKNIDFPACIDDAVSVSTLATYSNDDGTHNIANNSNVSKDTDFAAYGTFSTSTGRVALSSSAATAALAAHWAKSYAGSFDTTYNLLQSNGEVVKGYDNVKAVFVK